MGDPYIKLYSVDDDLNLYRLNTLLTPASLSMKRQKVIWDR
ncbi:MAG: hypothetical protein AB2L14_21840 [Candidatus Xenobiia bacterium LiM19]